VTSAPIQRSTRREDLLPRFRLRLLAKKVGGPIGAPLQSSLMTVRKHLTVFVDAWNRDPTPVIWTKSAHSVVRDTAR
jgi:hypothetical protein